MQCHTGAGAAEPAVPAIPVFKCYKTHGTHRKSLKTKCNMKDEAFGVHTSHQLPEETLQEETSDVRRPENRLVQP